MAGVVEYLPKASPVHRLNPLAKMAWALVVLVLSMTYTDYFYLIVLFHSVLAVALCAGVLREIAGLFKGLFTFAFILFLMQVLFFDAGTELFKLLPVGRGYLGVTDQGIEFGVAMAFRMLSVVVSFLVFLTTTRTQDMLNTLVEKLRVPYDFAFMVLTAIRFIPTFIGELKQIADAQKSRAFVVEGWNPVNKIKAYLPIAVPLVLSSLKKARQMALAMETRGYGAGRRTYLKELTIVGTDIVIIVLAVLLLVAGITARLAGYGTMN